MSKSASASASALIDDSEIYNEKEMSVKKRNGAFENVSFDKILARVKALGVVHKISINYVTLVIKIIDQLYDKIETAKIDELTAEQAASMASIHPDYGVLASVLVISNLHKKTNASFSKSMNQIYNFTDVNNAQCPLLAERFIETVNRHASRFDQMIDYGRDYLIDFFGFKTLERGYLIHVDKVIVERPQHLWLRVAIGIHDDDLDAVKETYDLMSQKYFTHATPTLFNAGTPRPQLSSCFLIATETDSVDGIYNTLKECANISKWAGGIGLHIHNVRAKGSHIRGTNGTSGGIVPMLAVFNKTARYINQGGRRNGSFAIYMEPHHADIEDFLDLKKNHGDEELRSRDLFYALWISDLFMERVKADATWSLFCPDSAPGLSDCHSNEFNRLYQQYETEQRYIRQIKARDLWIKILDSQMETGTPYMLYKDAANQKSNQQNLGTIMSSNLCSEICEFSSPDETAVCNLASVGLSKFIVETDAATVFLGGEIVVYTKEDCSWCVLLKALLRRKNVAFKEIKLATIDKEQYKFGTVPQLIVGDKLVGGFTAVLDLLRNRFDYALLHKVVKVITRNLNKVIDVNFYPTEKARRSNLYHRPIGIGVQGLADAFILMDIAFYSDAAKDINTRIFETIYHAALEQSMELARDRRAAIEFLREEYMSSWTFKTSHDLCQEYEVFDFITASSIETMMNEEKVTDLLQRYKPIRREIETIDLYGGSYSSFAGSPASQGVLQFDLWHISPSSGRYDWATMKADIQKYGLRNSLLVAPMPTASTSQILGNNECFEPLTSNIYTRRTLAGEFVLANKYLIQELIELGIWTQEIKNQMIVNKGSIQAIDAIPKFVKEKYKIVWEIPMKHLIDMARDRGAFVCQSQSLNLWLRDPDAKSLTNMHFYSWNAGLKTGMYYLRRKPKAQPQQFTIAPAKNERNSGQDPNPKDEAKKMVCDGDSCMMCSG